MSVEGDRNRVPTMKGKEFQKEIIAKEMKRLKRKLTDQTNLIGDSMKSNDMELVKR